MFLGVDFRSAEYPKLDTQMAKTQQILIHAWEPWTFGFYELRYLLNPRNHGNLHQKPQVVAQSQTRPGYGQEVRWQEVVGSGEPTAANVCPYDWQYPAAILVAGFYLGVLLL